MKKCKGTGKATGFGCGEELAYTDRNGIKTYLQKYGLGFSCCCYTNWLLGDTTEAQKTLDSFLINHKKKYEAEKSKLKVKEKKEAKEKIKTLSDWKKDLEKEINAIIRQIDKGHGCVATNSKTGKMNAGHYFSVGNNPTVRFHLENIWLQSEHSNNWKGGDTLRYQDGIIKLFGLDYLDRLSRLKSIEPIKLNIDDLKVLIPKARGILKWLKLQDRQFTNQERLDLRFRFNKELGIYDELPKHT